MRLRWRGKTFPDKGHHGNGTVVPFRVMNSKGFSLSVNHSIIEDRDPRFQNKIEVKVNVFRSGPPLASPQV